MKTGKTIDGLQYALKRAGNAAAFVSLGVRCGTRAEGDRPEGTAHFVEHAIFRGTANRTAEQINSPNHSSLSMTSWQKTLAWNASPSPFVTVSPCYEKNNNRLSREFEEE